MTKSRNSCQFSTTDQFVCLPGRRKKKTPQHKKQSKAKQKHRDKSGYQNWAQRQGAHSFRLVSSHLVWSGLLGSGLCPRLRLSPHIDHFSQALRRLHINTFFCRRFFKVCLFFRFFLFIFFFLFFSMSLTVKFSFPGWGTHTQHFSTG